MTKLGESVLFLSFIVAALLGLLFGAMGVSLLASYLLSLNITTVLCYGYDKHQSRMQGRRVPEINLHLFTALGGTLGAIAGQILFHHKTRKSKFRNIFFTIVIVQVMMLIAIASMRVN